MLNAFAVSAPDNNILPHADDVADTLARLATGASGKPPPSIVNSLLDKAIQRLEIVVDQETAALQARTAIDLKDYNNKKSQGLLDLSRVLRHFDAVAMDQEMPARLSRLRGKLEINQAVLKMHLEAVREISTIMAGALRDAESDGTYSPSIRGTGKGP